MLDGVILLGSGLLFVLLFRKLGLGATLGFLVAGALVGPQALGLVGGAEAKIGVAELGITLLLFIVGLELNPTRLWRLKQEIFGLGLMQVVACGVAVSGVVALSAELFIRGGVGAWPPARLVLNGTGLANVTVGRTLADTIWRTGLFRSCCSRICQSFR